MNARERLLAVILILVMAGAAGAAGFWQFIWKNYKKHDQDIAKLEKEIAALEDEKHAVEQAAYVYETKTKKKSLPAHIDLAKREYSRLLNNMLRKAEFDAADLKVTNREANTTNVPTLAPKTYAYTRLEFELSAKGDLTSVVDFLYHFYRQPLLHQITRITVVKPSGGRGRGGDLDITMLVQAIVLDKAENRGGLLPSTPAPAVTLVAGCGGSVAFNNHSLDIRLGIPLASADVLARAGDNAARQNSTQLQEYRRIAGKNIFHGPAPSPKEEPRARDIDLSPFVALILVTHNGDVSAQAVIFDRFNKHYYEITQDRGGAISIFKFYYIYPEENGIRYEVKKKFSDDDYDSRSLTFGSKETGNERAFRVRRILESDIIIEPYIEGRSNLMKFPATAILGGTAELALPGTLFSWHVGQFLKSDQEGLAPVQLSTREARQALLRPLNFAASNASPAVPANEDAKKDATKRKRGS